MDYTQEKQNNSSSPINFHLVSLGCDKNLVDSEMMLGVLGEAGYALTEQPEEAHVIVVNTCGFIADASSESIETILELSEHKKTGACQALVVTGCLAQRYKDQLKKELPEIDAIVGVGDLPSLVRTVAESLGGAFVEQVTDKNHVLSEEYYTKRRLSTPGYYAHLKIAEGCDNHCTYCTIPSIRGKYRSRPIESIVKEAEGLAGQGVKELILVAQDTAAYGTDLYGESRLHQLLSALSAVEGIEWMRLLYAYPEHLTEATITEMANNPKVCHYIDMPIQHAHDQVLKRMGRQFSREQLEALIQRLRVAMPDIALRTTVLVGFPGETDEEFESLVDFIQKVKFDKLGAFAYSQEEGTPAAKMKEQVLQKVKKARLDKVMRLQKDISREKGEMQVGRRLTVMVDGRIPEDNVMCGRSYRDCPDVDGLVFFESALELVSGDMVQVDITHAGDYDLMGALADESGQ